MARSQARFPVRFVLLFPSTEAEQPGDPSLPNPATWMVFTSVSKDTDVCVKPRRHQAVWLPAAVATAVCIGVKYWRRFDTAVSVTLRLK